jgi:hypothetical protein
MRRNCEQLLFETISQISPASSRRLADYNGNMARGWESKSVEQQQEEFASNKGGAKVPLSSQQIAAAHERNGIELSRQHILQQLQVACNPRHRQMLEAALAELDRKLGR